MPRTSKRFRISLVIYLLLVAFAAYLRTIRGWESPHLLYLSVLGHTVTIAFFIGMIYFWMMSLNRRIMQRHTRAYLLTTAVAMLVWNLIKAVKWYTATYTPTLDRFLWYAYYIPLISICLLTFFVSLSAGKDENYLPHKSWYLLYIPSILLVLLVLTNDLHQLAFAFENINDYNSGYSYGFIYWLFLIYSTSLIIASFFSLVKNMRNFKNKRAILLPLLPLFVMILYLAAYQPFHEPLHQLTDLTTTTCIVVISFWELCIQIGLIASNGSYRMFFNASDIDAQVLDKQGNLHFISKDTPPLSPEQFAKLKTEGKIESDHSTLLHMSPIDGGFVSWYENISEISDKISEIESINSELYSEVSFLEQEKRMREQRARLAKQREIYDLLSADLLPQTEKISERVKKAEGATGSEKLHLLGEICSIGVYAKRRSNLLLMSQMGDPISANELRRCIEESLGVLSAVGATASFNMSSDFEMTHSQAILCYSLFQSVIECAQFRMTVIHITISKTDDKLRMTIQLSGGDCHPSKMNTLAESFTSMQSSLVIEDEGDSHHISFLLQGRQEVAV